MSKKIITTAGTEFAQNGADLAMIEQTQRSGKPVMISSTDLNEGFSNAEADVKALVGFDVEGEEITVDPTTSKQTKTPSKGKNAITKVTVNAVTSAIDANIVAENIKKDVTILGVTGTHEGSAPVPEKVALDQKHEYTAIHFITENYSTEISDDMYNKLAEIIGEQAENPFYIKNDNNDELYGIMPHGDSMVAQLTLFRYYGEGASASAIPLNTYTISVNYVDDHYSASITISESLLTDKLITKQGTTCTLDSATATFDIDVLSLIAFAYTDEVVTPTNE